MMTERGIDRRVGRKKVIVECNFDHDCKYASKRTIVETMFGITTKVVVFLVIGVAIIGVLSGIILKYSMIEKIDENNSYKKQMNQIKISDVKLDKLFIKVDKLISMSGTVIPRDDQILSIARSTVAAQSILKVQEIRRLLHKYNKEKGLSSHAIDFEENIYCRNIDHQKILKDKILQILVRNTKVYIDVLNGYSHYKIGRIGDYIWNKFPMESLMEGIYELTVYSKELDVDRIADNVMNYMVNEAQPDFFDDMARDMKQ